MSFQILWLWSPYKESRHVSKREGRKLQDQVLSGLSHHSISSLSASHRIMVTRDCKWGQLETLKLAMKSMENSELQKGTKLGPFQPREKARGGDPNLVNRYRRVDQGRKSSRVGKRSKIENTQTHTHTHNSACILNAPFRNIYIHIIEKYTSIVESGVKEGHSLVVLLFYIFQTFCYPQKMIATLKHAIQTNAPPRLPATMGGAFAKRGPCLVQGLIRTHGPQRFCGVGWPVDEFSIWSFFFFSSHFPPCTKITLQKSIYLSYCCFTAFPH